MPTSDLSLPERVAVLEQKVSSMQGDLTEIKEKLDALLELKAKGLGALSLVSIIVGSGVIGLIITLMNFFGRPHL